MSKLVVQTDIPRAAAFCAMKQLKLHTYYATFVQELLPPDLPHHLALCKWFLKFVHDTV